MLKAMPCRTNQCEALASSQARSQPPCCSYQVTSKQNCMCQSPAFGALFASKQSMLLNFVFDLNYFLWRLKTLTRQGVSFFWKSKSKIVCASLPPLVLLFASKQSMLLTFVFDLNYFLWRLKTLTRQGVSFFWKSNVKLFHLK